MAKVGKKYAEAAKLFNKQKQYDVAEAIDILKKMDTAKFDETVEVHIKLGVDQQMRDFGQASTAIQAFADVLALQK